RDQPASGFVRECANPRARARFRQRSLLDNRQPALTVVLIRGLVQRHPSCKLIGPMCVMVTAIHTAELGDQLLFKRILVPLDFTEKNLRAIEVARQLALQSRSSVALLHVIETVEHVPIEELKDFYAKLEETARERMALPARMILEQDLVVEP